MQLEAQNSYEKPGSRTIGRVNWVGLWTLYARESRRFMKVWTQTLVAPAVTTILFMIIFSLALGGQGRMVANIPYPQFLAPGLILMAILQNAFANTSSSILIAKIQGTIIDSLMPPLSSLELTIGYTLGGITRGIVVGVSVSVAFMLMPGITLNVSHWWSLIYFSLAASTMLSLVGVLTGVWAEKFDHSAAITNFVIAPLSLLSGTFYSIERLSESWQIFSSLNPFFYLIDGFRYSFIGHADSNLSTGVYFTLTVNILLVLLVYKVFQKGYRLKA